MEVACFIRCDAMFRQVDEALTEAGFSCSRYVHETSFMRALRRKAFSLILAETAECAADEPDSLTWLANRSDDATPLIMVSPLHNPAGVTRALQAGADSFVYLPLELSELGARAHAVLRRNEKKLPRQRRIDTEGFSLNRDTGVLLDNGVPVDLTPREFMMAWVLFSSPGVFLSRDAISMTIWGVDSEITYRTIEQHVYKLRKKLNLCAERGVWIRTAYTKGYCLQIGGVEDAPEPLHPSACRTAPELALYA